MSAQLSPPVLVATRLTEAELAHFCGEIVGGLYQADVSCGNCYGRQVVVAVKGKTIANALNQQRCIHCGCDDLRKVVPQ